MPKAMFYLLKGDSRFGGVEGLIGFAKVHGWVGFHRIQGRMTSSGLGLGLGFRV